MATYPRYIPLEGGCGCVGGAGKVGHPIGPGEVVGRLEEVESGALESQEKASLEFWGYGRRGHVGVVRGGPFFFSSLAERAITAVPVTALQKEAIVTSSAMPRFHQAETKNKGRQRKKQPSKTNNTKPTKHKPPTKHLSGNRAAYACTTYN